MTCLRPLSIGLISMMLIVQLSFAPQTFAATPPAGAQSAKQIKRERLNRIMDPAADVEEFRQEFNNYLTEMADVIRLFNEIKVVREELNRGGLRPLEMLAQAKRSVAELSTADLIAMRAAYTKAPRWREQPNSLRSLLKPGFQQQLETRLANKKNGDVTAEVADNCLDGINAGITNTDIAIADAFRIGAEAIQDVIPPPFNFVAVAATAVTKGVVLLLQTLKNIKDDCEGDAFEAAIQDQVAASTTTITSAVSTAQAVIVNNDNTNTTNIVNNDNTNTANLTTLINFVRNQIIANANANKDELKNLILRTQIEADLASTDGSTFVALYETPSTTCTASVATPPTQCGLLDLVRTIVSETIANVGAGTNAQSFFDTETRKGQPVNIKRLILLTEGRIKRLQNRQS